MTEQMERTIVEKIRDKYTEQPQEKSKFEQLRDLDKKVKRPALIFAYIHGILGSLILGTGMCFAMQILLASVSAIMYVGIGVGAIGIVIMATAYPIYKAILKRRKNKYSEIIISKSNELLNA